MKPNRRLKKAAKVLATLGIPLLIVGFSATAVSATTFSLTAALVGIAFSGLAFILLSDILE